MLSKQMKQEPDFSPQTPPIYSPSRVIVKKKSEVIDTLTDKYKSVGVIFLVTFKNNIFILIMFFFYLCEANKLITP